MLIAHLDAPVVPAELWRAWNPDVLLVPLAGRRARRPRTRPSRRQRAGGASGRSSPAIVTLAVALVSPLDALSSSLASAHMVQHLLLTVVAAPLLVVSAPIPTLLRGLPRSAPPSRSAASASPRTTSRRRRGRVPSTSSCCGGGTPPRCTRRRCATTWSIGSSTSRSWSRRCSSWTAILAPAGAGIGVLVLFGLSVQSGLLGALMTFAREPWYPTYAGRTEAWGLSPLADQQLAGVIMWVPGGGAYLVAALALLTSLVAADDRSPPGRLRDGAARRTARDRRSADHGRSSNASGPGPVAR